MCREDAGALRDWSDLTVRDMARFMVRYLLRISQRAVSLLHRQDEKPVAGVTPGKHRGSESNGIRAAAPVLPGFCGHFARILRGALPDMPEVMAPGPQYPTCPTSTPP